MTNIHMTISAAASLALAVVSGLPACSDHEATAQASQAARDPVPAAPAADPAPEPVPATPAAPRANPARPTAGGKPNILFIMGDDIGWMQASIYHRGLMVGETPNIDRIGHEGAMFVDYLAMQSCTSGRNAFSTKRGALASATAELVAICKS